MVFDFCVLIFYSMLETSKDFLFIVLGFCALWLTIFFSWLMYYIIKIFRSTSHIISKATEVLDKIDDFIESIKAKAEKSASHLVILGELAKKGIDFMEKKKQDRGGKAEETSKKGSKKKK